MKKFVFFIIALSMILSAVSGCTSEPAVQDKSSAENENTGVLRIGFEVHAPMNYYDENGGFIGFDTEYAKAVCDILGVEPEFTEIDWDKKEELLVSGDIDCIWNGLTVTEERKSNMDFTQPYMRNQQVIVIREEDAEKYTGKADLKAARIAFESGTTGQKAVMQDDSLKSCSCVTVDDTHAAIDCLLTGECDAAVIDSILADALVSENSPYKGLAVIPDTNLPVEEFAVGCRKGSDLVNQINSATSELEKNGVLDELAAEYQIDRHM